MTSDRSKIGDRRQMMSSHVLPALMRKFHEAKIANGTSVTIWGSGKPLREFLHVEDLARGVVFCLNKYDGYEHINCGAGSEVSISRLAELVKEIVGFSGSVILDPSKPDGTPRKVMDSSRLRALGWKPTVELREGIERTYAWFLAHVANQRHAA